jgi:hypothetical protein
LQLKPSENAEKYRKLKFKRPRYDYPLENAEANIIRSTNRIATAGERLAGVPGRNCPGRAEMI